MAVVDGSPLPVIDGLVIGCDSSRVEHTVRGRQGAAQLGSSNPGVEHLLVPCDTSEGRWPLPMLAG
jgi:hypothetical protein